ANVPTAPGTLRARALSGARDGAALNLYETGEAHIPSGNGVVTVLTDSSYPREGRISLRIADIEGDIAPAFTLSLRVPGFASQFRVECAKDPARVLTGEPGTYADLTDLRAGDEFLITFAIPLVRHQAPHGSNRAGDDFAAFTYGSLLLARDSRDEDPLKPIPDAPVESYRILPSERKGFLKAEIVTGGETLRLVDYMSAGNGWAGGTFASWLPVRR
ncbi:MAG: glycoside hydrolase family 127 protein, partial [Clostridia bacterium]|nr:glycoside hydrolase family 127 protein [Clostridia bacterium]